jgi:hypothetical protein
MNYCEPKLPRRDLIILPCLSLLTVLVLLVGCEVAARFFFPSSEEDTCIVADSNIGFRFRPNCTAHLKVAEGPWVTNQYNECGYRTHSSCAPPPAGTARIALIGASASLGLFVDYDQTFATRTGVELTQRCHRPVEVQNLGRQVCSPACVFHRMDEALALKPDVVVFSVSPHDLETMAHQEVVDRYLPIAPARPSQLDQKKGADAKSLQKLATGSRSVIAAEHFLFQDPATYLKMYLVYGDKADFLRHPFTDAWQHRFTDFDLILGEMAAKAHAANVPFVLVEIPSLAQISILSLHAPPPGVDAYAFNSELEAISAHHGIEFVNVLDTFRNLPGSNKDFYMVDGHLNADGEALISAPLVDKLAESNIPALSSCVAPLETASLHKAPGSN